MPHTSGVVHRAHCSQALGMSKCHAPMHCVMQCCSWMQMALMLLMWDRNHARSSWAQMLRARP
jgi:hypothetical protein